MNQNEHHVVHSFSKTSLPKYTVLNGFWIVVFINYFWMDDEEDTDARSSTDTPGDLRYIINFIFFIFSIQFHLILLICAVTLQIKSTGASISAWKPQGLCCVCSTQVFRKHWYQSRKKKDSTLYRCLMGCKAKFDKHGKEKLLSVQDKSVYNCRRHIKVSNRIQIAQYIY